MNRTDAAAQGRESPWPDCPEPYRTELQKLAHAWISGRMTGERLALAILALRAEMAWVRQPDPEVTPLPMATVERALSQLTTALLQPLALEASSEAQRRALFAQATS